MQEKPEISTGRPIHHSRRPHRLWLDKPASVYRGGGAVKTPADGAREIQRCCTGLHEPCPVISALVTHRSLINLEKYVNYEDSASQFYMNKIASVSLDNTPKIASPIDSELSRIEQKISNIGELIMAHRGVLSSVLRGESDKAQSNGTAPREVEQSALHARLREFADRLEHISGAIYDLTQRVTL